MSIDSAKPQQNPLFLTDADVEALADWPSAIEAIRAAYSVTADESGTPGRLIAKSKQEWMRIMPSVPATGRFFGAKSIVGSFADGLQVSYLVSLFDKETADLVALIDGNRVTGLRTAATTAVGAATLVPKRSLVLGIIGSGFEARSHLTAFSHLMEFVEVRVFSPTVKNRERFAAEYSETIGISVRAVGSAEEAVVGADLVLCAARSRDESPTIESAWVGQNATVISIGSTTPEQRELPTNLIARAARIVVDTYEEVVHESGDMLAAARDGIELEGKVVTLNTALADDHDIDVAKGIRIYKSTGSGIQDIVVSEMLFNRALAEGRGTRLPVGIVTSRK